MDRIQLQQGLNALYRDLETAESMDEETACKVYNVDCKAEIIEVIKEEIETYEAILQPEDADDGGMDYSSLQMVQGMAVTQW